MHLDQTSENNCPGGECFHDTSFVIFYVAHNHRPHLQAARGAAEPMPYGLPPCDDRGLVRDSWGRSLLTLLGMSEMLVTDSDAHRSTHPRPRQLDKSVLAAAITEDGTAQAIRLVDNRLESGIYWSGI